MTAIEVIGLEVTDCTGVLIGNTDIPVPEHVPTEVKPGTTPMPVYPTQDDKDGGK